MKLPLQPKHLPWFTIATGAVGFGLGMWLFSTGFDAKGLLMTYHPANLCMIILSVLTVAALLIATARIQNNCPYKQLFPASVPAAIGDLAAAAGILATAIYEIVTGTPDTISLLCCIFGVVAAGSFCFLAFSRLRGTRPHPIFHTGITVYFMLHLICQYRMWISETQVQIYAAPLLASVFLMLRTYYYAMLDAGNGSRRMYTVCNCCAQFFCILALCNDNPVFYACLAICTATSHCAVPAESAIPSMYLPREVLYCINTLKQAGHSAYAVGGCVRDALLGQTPADYDICTSASPEQTAQAFSRHELVQNGEKHGTVGVIIGREVFEITTFRTEGGYSDSRRPDWVEFVATIDGDLARRDFTINAMAYSPDEGYIDQWGGQEDLKNKILRAVGDPVVRFSEDPLRILRGVRFTVRLGLTPDENTLSAMLSQAPLLDKLSRERVFSELCKLLPYVKAEDMIRFAPIFTQVIPELASCVGFQQHSPHHAYDVYTHTAHVVASVPPEVSLRLAALLHDICKPTVFTQDENGRGHFYGHAREGGKLADAILLRLKASNVLRSQVIFLIENHMTPLEPDKKLLRHRIAQFGLESVWRLLTLQRADYTAKGVEGEDYAYFDEVEQLLEEIRQEGSALSAKDLAINGQDLLALGLEPGPHIGECMTFLLGLVHDELATNTKEDLLTAAKKFFNMEDRT